jgi:competence protein ComEA
MNNLNNNKKIIIVIIVIVLGLGGYYVYNNFGYNNNQIESVENGILVSNNEENTTNTTEEKSSNKIIVHITGEVVNPGIVELEEGERIFNAIEKAGGTTKDADTSKINLAYVVEDGMKINVPNVNDKSENEEYISIAAETDSEKSNSTTQTTVKNLVNINTATQTELETLPGIGPSIATKIINYRKEKGKFSKIEDIKNVSGIGDAKYENIKNLIKVK